MKEIAFLLLLMKHMVQESPIMNLIYTTTLSTDKTCNIATSVDRDYADPDIPASVMGDLLYDYVRI